MSDPPDGLHDRSSLEVSTDTVVGGGGRNVGGFAVHGQAGFNIGDRVPDKKRTIPINVKVPARMF